MAPETSKIIDAGISVRHAKNWSVPEALREILQNYLDVRSEFDVGGSVTWCPNNETDDLGNAEISDQGPGLEMRHFAFGESEKGTDMIGQFGEGLKSAMLHLIREGRTVEIWSANYRVQPIVADSEIFGIPTLHYHFQEEEEFTQGTAIYVTCTQEELNDAKSYFVEFAKGKSNFSWIVENEVSLPGGKCYVNGSYICDIPSYYSYHLTDKRIINRDRNSVDMAKVKDILVNLIRWSDNNRLIQTFMELLLDKHDYLENQLFVPISSGNRDKWTRIWKEKIAPTITWTNRPILLSSGNPAMDSQAEYDGYKVIQVSPFAKYCLEDILINVQEQTVKDKMSAQFRVRQKDLNQEEFRNLSMAKKLVRKHYTRELPLGNVEVWENLCSAGGSPVWGQYNHSKDLILLDRSVLASFENTLHTLLHEAVHKKSGESDLTSEFQRALLNVAVGIITKHGKIK